MSTSSIRFSRFSLRQIVAIVLIFVVTALLVPTPWCGDEGMGPAFFL